MSQRDSTRRRLFVSLLVATACGDDPVEAVFGTDGATSDGTTTGVTGTNPSDPSSSSSAETTMSTSTSVDSTDDGGSSSESTTDTTGNTTGATDSSTTEAESSTSTSTRGSSSESTTTGDETSTGEPPGCGEALGNVIFVDANAAGAGDGSSWANAYTTIAEAMQAAVPNDALWIAEGEYRGPAATEPVVVLETCVSLHGGFVGNEGSLDDRPLPLASTILHGDFADDDDANGFADNARHVIMATNVADVTLDGLVITGGRATAGGESNHGGGLYASDSTLVLVDVSFVANMATTRGGGLYATGSDVTLVDPSFASNTASIGGGAHVRQGSTAVFDAPTVTGNSAVTEGGGLYAFSSTLEVTDGLFDSNAVTGVLDTYGGGAVSAATTTLQVVGSSFTGNSGRNAGALWTSGTSPAEISDCTFVGNTAVGLGGAMRLDSPGTTTNVTFEGNVAAQGGAVHRQGGVHTLESVLFIGNEGAISGGAMRIVSGPTTMSNVLFDLNETDGVGGALSINSPHAVVLEDAVFSNNSAVTGGGAVHGEPSNVIATVTVRDSSFSNNAATGLTGVGGALFTQHAATAHTFVIDSCTFTGNTAVTSGGAIHAEHRLVVRNSAFADNQAATLGGGIVAVRRESYPRIASSTLHANQAASGSAIALLPGSGGLASLRNLVVWGDGLVVSGAAEANVSYVCSPDALLPGEGNVLAMLDPIELGPTGELFLDQGSACIDTGDDAAATADYTELGLDWQTLTTALTGTLDAPPVDMGIHYAP